MAFKIKPFKELISLSKEALDTAMIPLRVRAAKAKADSLTIKLEEQMLTLEQQINIACAAKDIDFDEIAERMDEYELLERRITQVKKLTTQLFPEAA